jgi:hypothetical protein
VVPAHMFRKVISITKSHCKLGLTVCRGVVSHDQRILCTLPEEGLFSEEAGEDLNAGSMDLQCYGKTRMLLL